MDMIRIKDYSKAIWSYREMIRYFSFYDEHDLFDSKVLSTGLILDLWL